MRRKPMSDSVLRFKEVGGHSYVHAESFPLLSPDARAQLTTADRVARLSHSANYNVARFDITGQRIALLNYPRFFEDAFPALRESWQVDLSSGTVSYRTYGDSLNPPILHRAQRHRRDQSQSVQGW